MEGLQRCRGFHSNLSYRIKPNWPFPVPSASGYNSFDFMTFYLAIIVFIGTYVWLVTEKTPRPWVVLFGAAALIFGHVLSLRQALHYVEWGTIGLLIGLFILVEVLATAGLFEWMALVLNRAFDGR